MIYGGLLAWRGLCRSRPGGILLIGAGFFQVAGNPLLFYPPEAGSHVMLLLLPVLSIVVIHRKDRAWWWGFVVLNMVLVFWLELKRDDWEPPLVGPLSTGDHSVWAAVALCLTAAVIVGVFYNFHRDLHLARLQIQTAHDRSETLLDNLLPNSIAERLKDQEGTIADHFEEASVLFADLVGFTELAASQSASQTVDMLNEIFSAFDQLVVERDLEKIKTIGDAYMVASGIPVPSSEHAGELLGMAKEILAIVERYNEDYGCSLGVRVGMNSGPLTAGVLGSRKLTYDIWGDTVNVASRMESTGIPGRIQVTEAVVQALGDETLFEERGLVPIKGKGQMRTFFVA